MPQSEDKISLNALNKEIEDLESLIEYHNDQLEAAKIRLENVTHQKKSMENYLNSDNN